MPSASGQSDAQICSNRAAAVRPQPVNYGLTYDDLNLYSSWESLWSCRLDDGKVIRCLGTRDHDEYKEGRRWFCILHYWKVRAHTVGGLAFWLLLIGSLATTSKDSRLGGVVTLGLGLACVLCAILPGVVIKDLRRRASPGLIAYWQALHAYDDNKAAAEAAARQATRDAEAAARQAARDAELRKRSYWEFLDGYAFERATAEVLKLHQFDPTVTPGSGDGGIDIEVTRNGLRGVVQCKAHVSCVGPHVVRDLYGVIHHSGADFGIIVSRGGFTKGAVDFGRNKPILFVDISDLIAMQEGQDVLAGGFTRTDS
jgi:restriction endonuclease